MITSVAGITKVICAFARSMYSYWPLHTSE